MYCPTDDCWEYIPCSQHVSKGQEIKQETDDDDDVIVFLQDEKGNNYPVGRWALYAYCGVMTSVDMQPNEVIPMCISETAMPAFITMLQPGHIDHCEFACPILVDLYFQCGKYQVRHSDVSQAVQEAIAMDRFKGEELLKLWECAILYEDGRMEAISCKSWFHLYEVNPDLLSKVQSIKVCKSLARYTLTEIKSLQHEVKNLQYFASWPEQKKDSSRKKYSSRKKVSRKKMWCCK